MVNDSRDGEANGDLPDSNSGDCGFESRPSYQHKIPEWHVVYKEWAIHTPTGRLRHLVCKRDIMEFAKFKKVAQYAVWDEKTKQTRIYKDECYHNRRAILMDNKESIIHPCQGTDPYEEIEDIIVPAMVVEIAICYMKV